MYRCYYSLWNVVAGLLDMLLLGIDTRLCCVAICLESTQFSWPPLSSAVWEYLLPSSGGRWKPFGFEIKSLLKGRFAGKSDAVLDLFSTDHVLGLVLVVA